MNPINKARKKIGRYVVKTIGSFFPPVIVLLYHRVIDTSNDFQQLAVSPGNFKDQIAFLKSNYQLLNFEDDWTTVKEPAVVITFDDGYHDNYVNALPVLEEAGVSATFFITTGFVNRNTEFFHHEIERILFQDRRYPKALENFRGTGQTWPSETLDERRNLYFALHDLVKKMKIDHRDECMEKLRQWAGVDATARNSNRVMSLDELVEFSKHSCVRIGAHTVNHPQLSQLSYKEQYLEIAQSKKALENWTQKNVLTFAYPYGTLRDYNLETISICKQVGFKKVASNYPAPAHRLISNYEIPRYLVRDWDLSTFKSQLANFQPGN
jgi:peptidoglycan/xylan/chitin deacetylase (PgdA/CDA1 family)